MNYIPFFKQNVCMCIWYILNNLQPLGGVVLPSLERLDHISTPSRVGVFHLDIQKYKPKVVTETYKARIKHTKLDNYVFIIKMLKNWKHSNIVWTFKGI
jgi:hypothetical protein